MNARERAGLAAEQAAARKRDRRILIMVIAAFVVIVVAGGIAFQAWRTSRAPSSVSSVSASASPVTVTNGRLASHNPQQSSQLRQALAAAVDDGENSELLVFDQAEPVR